MDFPPPDPRDDIEELAKNRRIAMKMARNALYRGSVLAGMLFELESAAGPLAPLEDYNEDSFDLDVFL